MQFFEPELFTCLSKVIRNSDTSVQQVLVRKYLKLLQGIFQTEFSVKLDLKVESCCIIESLTTNLKLDFEELPMSPGTNDEQPKNLIILYDTLKLLGQLCVTHELRKQAIESQVDQALIPLV